MAKELKDYTTEELVNELRDRHDVYGMRVLTRDDVRKWAEESGYDTGELLDKFMSEQYHEWALDDYLGEKARTWLENLLPMGEE